MEGTGQINIQKILNPPSLAQHRDIGDAVMAAFMNPLDAKRAALVCYAIVPEQLAVKGMSEMLQL